MGAPATQLAPSDIDGIITERIASERINVPAFPEAVARLHTLVGSDRYTNAEVAKIIGTDQSLTASVLRYANSASVRGGREVASIQDAVARLGAREVLSLCIAVGVGSKFAADGPLAEIRYEIWRRSTFSAEFSRRVAPKLGVEPDTAFLCGLLADFGKAIAIACVEENVAAESTEAQPAEFWWAVAERHAHPLGQLMASKWRLPAAVAAVVGGTANSTSAPEVVTLVRLAQMAHEVAELLDRRAGVTAAELAALPSIANAQLAAHIEAIVPTLPELVVNLTPVIEPSKRKGGKLSLVEPPDTTVKGKRFAAQMPVHYLRAASEQRFTCTVVARTGMVFTGDAALPINIVAKLRVEHAPSFECFAHITRCVGKGAVAFELEAKPMALDGALRERWNQMVEEHVPAQDDTLGAPVRDEWSETTGETRPIRPRAAPFPAIAAHAARTVTPTPSANDAARAAAELHAVRASQPAVNDEPLDELLAAPLERDVSLGSQPVVISDGGAAQDAKPSPAMTAKIPRGGEQTAQLRGYVTLNEGKRKSHLVIVLVAMALLAIAAAGALVL